MMKKDSARYRISPHGKRKIEFPSKSVKTSVKLPLIGKTVYLDVKEPKNVKRLQHDLKTLGATIEEFVSKDINYLITSQHRPKVAKDPGGSPAPSPFNCEPSPSPSNVEERRVETVTRGKALLQKARTKSREANSLLDNAERWGVKIVPLEGAFKWIDRELRKLPRLSQHQKKSSRTKSVAKYKTIKTPYLKIENSNCRYRPFNQELDAWPHLSIDTPRGSCPFDGTQINRGSISHEERGEILPAQADTPSVQTPNEEKDAIDSNPTPHNNRDSQKASKNDEQDGCNYGNILTAGEIKRKNEAKRRQERKRGYCECCRMKYEDLDKHVRDDSHREYVRTKSHYTTLDTLINTGPSTATFLQTYLMLAVKHARKGTIQSTEYSDEEIALISPAKPELRQSPRKKDKLSLNRSPQVVLKKESNIKSSVSVLEHEDTKNTRDAAAVIPKGEILKKSPLKESKRTMSLSPHKAASPSTQKDTKLNDSKSALSPRKTVQSISPVKRNRTPAAGREVSNYKVDDKENNRTRIADAHGLCTPKSPKSSKSANKTTENLNDMSPSKGSRRSGRRINLTDDEISRLQDNESGKLVGVLSSPKKESRLDKLENISSPKKSLRPDTNLVSNGCSHVVTSSETEKVESESRNRKSASCKDLLQVHDGMRKSDKHHSSDDFEKCLAKEFDISPNSSKTKTEGRVDNLSLKKVHAKRIKSSEKEKKRKAQVKKTVPVEQSDCYSDIPSDFQCLSSTGELMNFSKTLAERIKERSVRRSPSVGSYNLNRMFNSSTVQNDDFEVERKPKKGQLSKKIVNQVEQTVKSAASVASAKVINKYKNRRRTKSGKAEQVHSGYQGDDEQEGHTNRVSSKSNGRGTGSKCKKFWYYVVEHHEGSGPDDDLERGARRRKEKNYEQNKCGRQSRLRSRIDKENEIKEPDESATKRSTQKHDHADLVRVKPLKENRNKRTSSKGEVCRDTDQNITEDDSLLKDGDKNVKEKYMKQWGKLRDYATEKEDANEYLKTLPAELRSLKSSWNKLSDLSAYSCTESEQDEKRIRRSQQSRSLNMKFSDMKQNDVKQSASTVAGSKTCEEISVKTLNKKGRRKSEKTDDLESMNCIAIENNIEVMKKEKPKSKRFWHYVVEKEESDDGVDECLTGLPDEVKSLKSSWNHLTDALACSASDEEIEGRRFRKPRNSRSTSLHRRGDADNLDLVEVDSESEVSEKSVLPAVSVKRKSKPNGVSVSDKFPEIKQGSNKKMERETFSKESAALKTADKKETRNQKSGQKSRKFWEFVEEKQESDDDEFFQALPKELKGLKSSWNRLTDVSATSCSDNEDRRFTKPRQSRPVCLKESTVACRHEIKEANNRRENPRQSRPVCLKESDAESDEGFEQAVEQAVEIRETNDRRNSNPRRSKQVGEARRRRIDNMKESESDIDTGSENDVIQHNSSQKEKRKRKKFWEYVPVVSPDKSVTDKHIEYDAKQHKAQTNASETHKSNEMLEHSSQKEERKRKTFWDYVPVVSPDKSVVDKHIEIGSVPRELANLKDSWNDITNMHESKRQDSAHRTSFLSDSEIMLKNTRRAVRKTVQSSLFSSENKMNICEVNRHKKEKAKTTMQCNSSVERDDKNVPSNTRTNSTKDNEDLSKAEDSNSEGMKLTKQVTKNKFWEYVVEEDRGDEEAEVDPSLPRELQALLRYSVQSLSDTEVFQGRRRKSKVLPSSVDCDVANDDRRKAGQQSIKGCAADKRTEKRSKSGSLAEERSIDRQIQQLNEIEKVSRTSAKALIEKDLVGRRVPDSREAVAALGTPPKKRKREDSETDKGSRSPIFKSSKFCLTEKRQTTERVKSSQLLKSPSGKQRIENREFKDQTKKILFRENVASDSETNTGKSQVEVTTPVKEKIHFIPQSGYADSTRVSKRKQWKRKKGDSQSSLSPKSRKDKKKRKVELCSQKERKESETSAHISKDKQEVIDVQIDADNIQKQSPSGTAREETDAENVALKWEPVKMCNTEPKCKIKLNKSWSVLSDRSVEKLLSSDDEGSFDGFQNEAADKINTSLRSDLSYEDINEIELNNDSDHEWIVEQEEGKGEKESPEKFDRYLMFSSPGKPSESSWMDACDTYIDKSLNRSQEDECNVSATSPWRTSRHSLFTGNVVKPVRTPTKVSLSVKGAYDEAQVEKVDRDIEFNFGSPQKDKTCYSPLRVRNGHIIDISSPPRHGNATSTPTRDDKKLGKKKKQGKLFDGLVFSGDETWCNEGEKSVTNEFRLLKKVSTIPKTFEIKYDASPPKKSKKKSKLKL